MISRFFRFLLVLSLGIGHSSAQEPSVERIRDTIDRVMERVMEAEQIPGAAIVVVKGDSLLVQRGYGVANRETGDAVDASHTIFRIGSISKALTVLGILRLVDEGRIDLDDPVSTYVPGLEIDTFAEPVRIRHLITHTAGFDQIGKNRQVDDPEHRISLRSFLEEELVPLRPPGTVAVYDTYGITLAGLLLEEVSGQSYARYMSQRLFEPLGMHHTAVETAYGERLAIGYGLEDGAFLAQPYEYYVTLPASSIDASAADMGRLLVALLDPGSEFLSDETIRRFNQEPQFVYVNGKGQFQGDGGVRAFSYGFFETEANGVRALHHGGVMAGYSSELFLVPDLGYGFFLAYNRDPETGPPVSLREQMADALADLFVAPSDSENARSSDPQKLEDAVPSPVETGRYAGRYANMVACFTCVPGEGWDVGWLTLMSPEPGVVQSSRRWVARDSFLFIEEGGSREMMFLADSDGSIRYLTLGPDSFVRLDEQLIRDVAGAGWRDRPATPIEATVYLAGENWSETWEAFSELAEQYPENGRIYYYGGLSALHTSRVADARRFFRRAVDLGRWVGWSWYYVASTWAAEGDSSQAFDVLEKALDAGFSDPLLLRSEPWWDGLRDHPRYMELDARIGG